jgi:4'-phosphopantetheinyl transferase EntD
VSWQEILPQGIAVAHGSIDALPYRLMFPEQALVRHAVPKRQLEFAAGRHYARAALALHGLDEVVILAGARREPLWPANIVGSITHTDTYCAAVAARAQDFAALGIDAEYDTQLAAEVATLVCTAAERRWCEQTAGRDVSFPAKLIFCLKESLFKALYPLARFNESFRAIEMQVDIEQSVAYALPATSCNRRLAALLGAVETAFGCCSGHVLAAAWVRRLNAPRID